jgi:hypothetical protein
MPNRGREAHLAYRQKDVLHVVAAIGDRSADIKVGTVPSKNEAPPEKN